MKILLHKNRFIAGCIGGSSKSNTQAVNQTSSGQASNISGRGTIAQPGSIAVGEGGQYRESGSVDLSNLKSSGTTNVNIVPQAALDTIKALGQNFADAVSGAGGGGGTTTILPGTAAQTTLPFDLSKWAIGLLLAFAGFFGLKLLLKGNSSK